MVPGYIRLHQGQVSFLEAADGVWGGSRLAGRVLAGPVPSWGSGFQLQALISLLFLISMNPAIDACI